jgi:hypothetical protein
MQYEASKGKMAEDLGGWNEREEATKLVRKRSDDEKSRNEPTRDRAEFDPDSYFV